MMKFKRCISWMLAVLMLVSVLGVPVRAQDGEGETYVRQLETLTIHNPLYGGEDGDDAIVSFQNTNTLGGGSGEYCATTEEAGAVLRAGMKARDNLIYVYYKTDPEDDVNQIVLEMLNVAVQHTGVPTEGDYIGAHWDHVDIGGQVYYDGYMMYYDFQFQVDYHANAAQEAELDAAVNALVNSLGLDGLSDYETICRVYDWMCTNITYDYDTLYDDTYKLKYSAYAALIHGTSVCQGYANLFYRLMLMQGIDCRLIKGISEGGAHSWNIVRLGDKYYNVDATFDSACAQAGVDYAHFLRCPANFPDHIRDTEYNTGAFHSAYPMAETDYVPDLDHTHSYYDKVVEPDCILGGFTLHTCMICGDHYKDAYTDPLGHSWDDGVLSGQDRVYTCHICGETKRESAGSNVEELPFSDWEWEVLKLTNRERIANGLQPLTGFAIFQSATDVRAEELTEYYSHTRPNGTECVTAMDEAGVKYYTWGENIAAGFDSPADVMQGWMNSSGHRANILNGKFLHMGVGYAVDYSTMYGDFWVQMFAAAQNEQYTSLTLVYPGEAFAAGTTIDDMGIYAVLENTVYGTCYLPITAEYCTGYDPELVGNQTVTVNVLGFDVSFPVNVTERIHTYGNWYNVKAPTCTEAGTQRRDCSCCDLYETREVDPTGHSHEARVFAPTCTEDGYTKYTCHCGDTYKDNIVEAPGHDLIGGDCLSFKWCQTCGEYVEELGDHDYTGGTIQGDANGHWQPCRICGTNGPTQPHTPNVAEPAQGEAQYCTVCRYFMGGDGSKYVIDEGLWDHGPLSWKITGDGTLTISGKGTFQSKTEYPWKAYSHLVTRIVVEDGARNIPEKAFSQMYEVSDIYIGKTVDTIGVGAFRDCLALKSVTIPAAVTKIQREAFFGCTGLETLSFAANGKLEKIDVDAFASTGIRELVTPASLKIIGESAFRDCVSLESIHLTEGLETVDMFAFWGCRNLKHLYIGETVADVHSDVFRDSMALETVEVYGSALLSGFPGRKNLKSAVVAGQAIGLGSGYFNGCSALESVTLGDGVTGIDYNVFSGCTSLKQITLPEGLTVIRAETFRNTGLTAITIPESVTELEWSVFEGTPLKSVYFLGDAPKMDVSTFRGVTADVYYNGDRTGWNANVLGNYGGTLTWINQGHIHNYVAESVKAPTCTETGYTVYTCACGDSYQGSETPKADHTFTKKIAEVQYLAPEYPEDCQTPRTYRYACEFCGERGTEVWTSEEYGPHKVDGLWTSEDGKHFHACTVSGCDYFEDAADCSGGTATCTEKAVCEVCGNPYGKALGHDLTEVKGFDATCTENGRKTYYTCHCGEKFLDAAGQQPLTDEKVLVIEKLGHDLTEVKGFDATCTENGRKTHYTCHCGEKFLDAAGQQPMTDDKVLVIEKLGHELDENGVCSRGCGYQEGQEPQVLLGDVNGDGKINPKDAAMVLQHFVGKPVQNFNAAAADVNGDGKINPKDAAMILQRFVGKLDENYKPLT